MPTETSPTPRTSAGKFYGWRIVAASLLIYFAVAVIGFYAHTVIMNPLRARHGWSMGLISTAITLYFFVAAFAGFVVGRQVDRHGPRAAIIGGAMVFGVGFISLAHISEPWQLFVIYLFMSVGYCSASVLSVSTVIANWFIRRRGLAMGVASLGLSAGGMILVPVISYLIGKSGLEWTLTLLGCFSMAVIIPITLRMIWHRPADLGQFPDGDLPDNRKTPTHQARIVALGQTRTWTRTQAIRTVPFWSIAMAFWLAMTGQTALMIHLVPFLTLSIGPAKAAYALSLTAGASMVGRLLVAPIIDRCEKRHLAMICFFIQTMATVVLAWSEDVRLLYLGTFIFGLVMGVGYLMLPLIIGECFGMVSFGTVFGICAIFTDAGSALGPMMAGLIYDATHSYQISLTILGAASGLAVVIVYFAFFPPKKQPTVPGGEGRICSSSVPLSRHAGGGRHPD